MIIPRPVFMPQIANLPKQIRFRDAHNVVDLVEGVVQQCRAAPPDVVNKDDVEPVYVREEKKKETKKKAGK